MQGFNEDGFNACECCLKRVDELHMYGKYKLCLLCLCAEEEKELSSDDESIYEPQPEGFIWHSSMVGWVKVQE